MAKQCMLSTVDNPFNPFTDYDKWLNYDMIDLGYNTCGLLARLAKTSDQLSDEENAAEVETVIDEIVANDPFDLYIKVEMDEDEIEKEENTENNEKTNEDMQGGGV